MVIPGQQASEEKVQEIHGRRAGCRRAESDLE